MADGDVPQTALDADLDARAVVDAWLDGLPVGAAATGEVDSAGSVVASGRPPRSAPGSRAARAAAATTAADAGARGNWVPTGPRNITGRIRALAVHPTDPSTMYAGAASGGVFKSEDGGETWAPSWTDDASQSIAGISICRAHPDVVWVATGEIRAGGGESILGSGIYRSDDGGASWTNAASPPVPGADTAKATTFDGVAAHPTDDQSCWAVGPAGVFRTRDGGATWSQFEQGVYYSDVAFSVDSGGNPVVFLVRAQSRLGEAVVVRVDAPDHDDAAVGLQIGDPMSAGTVVAAAVAPPPPAQPLPAWPARGKIAICESSPAVAYVRFVTAGGGGRHLGLFRTQTAQAAPTGGASGVVWVPIFDNVNVPPTDAGFQDDGQGLYDLAIGVNPDEPNELATGMLNVHVSLNANGPNGQVTFKRVLAEDLTLIDRAQHGDQHVTIFVRPPASAPAGTPPRLWVANDGGISSSDDWRTGVGYARGQTRLPVPVGATTWRKRFGIVAGQMYSLSQSPLLPTVFGCGFQDNGVLVTSGGPTWRVVIGADGGFLAFDPHDPYRLLATWQRQIDEIAFPGKLEGGFALPGYPAREGIWPRPLDRGFVARDTPLFVADTAPHPRRGDRVLHARLNRLYGSTGSSGDRWQPEAAGRGFDIEFTVPSTAVQPNAQAFLQVLPSAGAAKLGLPQQLAVRFEAAPTAAVAVVRSSLPGPYALADGDSITLSATNVPPASPPAATLTVTFRRPDALRGVPWSAAEVAAEITRQAGLPSHPCFWARPGVVEIVTTAVGPDAQITLGGTALDPPTPGGVSPLGLRARTYHGSAGRPATVTLTAPNVGLAPTATMKAPTGHAPFELTVAIGAGGPARMIRFDGDTFVDLDWIHAGELEQALAAALTPDPVTVNAVASTRRLLITSTGGPGVQVTGTAVPRLNLFGGAGPSPALECGVSRSNAFDLTPDPAAPGAPLTLSFNGGAALSFAQPANDLRTLTSEELRTLIDAHLQAQGVAARVDLFVLHASGFPSEIVYSRTHPDTAWVGGSDGTLHRTTNDGGRWDAIQPAALRRLDRQVEAIAIDPSDPQVVYAGLDGRPTAGVETDQVSLTHPGLLFKTSDGGATWTHVGADVKDAGGGLLGVYALQIDPAAPATVFAATEVGVFRSTDGGSSWQPFNEGLPPGIVRDLDFVPERRVVRAGVWGRGTYEREVGGAAARDVALFVRAGLLDDGSTRPAPQGPDVFASRPDRAPADESPDLKVARAFPATLGGSTTIDGVEFDEDVAHEPLVSGPATVFAQVHNRGAFPATAPRVACLWADASAGPPRLPDDFWATFHAGALPETLGAWSLVHDTRADVVAPHDVKPGYPVVVPLDVTWPGDVATRPRVGILLLVESAEDPLKATQLDVGELLAAEPKAAYRESATVSDHGDSTILVRATTRTAFTVAAPAAPLVSAQPTLLPSGFPPGPVTSVVSLSSLFFPLGPSPQDQALVFATAPQSLTVTFGAPIANPAQATIFEVADLIRTALIEADAPVTLDAPPVGAGHGLRLTGVSGTLVQVTGGTAAAGLGFALGALAPQVTGTVAAPYNLGAGAPQTLVFAFTKQTTVRFSRSPGFDPAIATAREVRAVLNREFAAAHLPLEAVAPQAEPWVRRSVTDLDGIPAPVAGRHLADVVAAPAAVAAAGQPALFDLVAMHAPAPVHASADNFLYLRVANLGNVDLSTADARQRLFALALGATPITLTAIGPAAGTSVAVPAGSSAVAEFHWNPGAAAAGDRLFVLAAADDKTWAPLEKDGTPLDATTTFAGVDELDRFCATNPGAAYRMFTVTT